MCSTFWVFISKIQMFWEAQRQTSPADSDGGEGRVDWTAAAGQLKRTQGRWWTGDHRPFSTNPAPAFSGKLALPDTVGCSPAGQGPPLPRVPSSPPEIRRVPAQPSKGLACPATPRDRDIKGPSPGTHLPCWSSWRHGRDSHPALLVLSTSNLRETSVSSHFETRRWGGALYCPLVSTHQADFLKVCHGFMQVSLLRRRASLTPCMTLGVTDAPLRASVFSKRQDWTT